MSSIEEAEILRERAYAFLRNAKRLFAEEEYDLAAFSIEQFCQRVLKYKLLIKTGTYPRTRSLLRLLRELVKLAPEKIDEIHRFGDNVPHARDTFRGDMRKEKLRSF